MTGMHGFLDWQPALTAVPLSRSLRGLVLVLCLGMNASFAGEPPMPDGRWGHTFVYFPPTDSFILYGGASEERSYRDDMWVWDGKSWLKLEIPTPSARGFAAAAYDPDRKAILLHGGRGNERNTFRDLWEWNGAEWRQLEPETPYGADHHVMVHLPEEGGFLVHGGWTGEGVSGQTWHWNGQWTPVADAERGPPPRGAFGMAYNGVRKRVELYGGLWVNGQYADAWAWSGGEWLSLSGPYDNSSLDHHSMFFDAETGEMLIFGGKDYRYTMRGETRRLAGGGLVETVADSGPEPRHSLSIATDDLRGRAVLFGGKIYAGEEKLPLADIWIWKGGAWHQVQPSTGAD